MSKNELHIIIWRPDTLNLLGLNELKWTPIKARRGSSPKIRHRWYFTWQDEEYSVDEGSIIPLHPETGAVTVLTRRHIGKLLTHMGRMAPKEAKVIAPAIDMTPATILSWRKLKNLRYASEYRIDREGAWYDI